MKSRNDLSGLHWAINQHAFTYTLHGDWQSAIFHAKESIGLLERSGNVWAANWTLLNLGYSLFMEGEDQLGLQNVQASICKNLEVGAPLWLGWCYGLQAELLALSGKTEEARNSCGESFSRIGANETIGDHVAFRAKALVAAINNPEDWPVVLEAMRRSLVLASASGSRPNQAITHFRYAECLHKKCDMDAAREQLSQAETLFQDMGMDWWMEQAQGLRGRIDRGEPFKWFAPFVDGPPQGIEQH